MDTDSKWEYWYKQECRNIEKPSTTLIVGGGYKN